MTIIESLNDIIHDHDRRFYFRRNFNTIAAMTALFIFVLSLILLMLQGTYWPWILSMWTAAAIAYFICRNRWLQADSDIIGSAMEKFNQACPVNTNERKIAMNALEEMSSASVTAAMIVSLFGGKRSLHYYYGWTEPPSSPVSQNEKEPGMPAAGKRLNFSGIIPLQIKKKIMGRNRNQKQDRIIRLDPDRPDKKTMD
jgi:hypothetical protein